MHALAAGTVALLLVVAMLPAVLLGGDDPPALEACGGVVVADHLDVILATIRSMESGGNYQTRVTSSTASGAYGFINSTWRHYAAMAGVDIGTYPSAWMAPPADQDRVAAVNVNQILAGHEGRIDLIPLAWYLPSSIGDPTKMDVVPPIGANTLTPRQYQTRWLARYEQERQRARLTDTATTTTTVNADPPTSPFSPPSSVAQATPGSCIGGNAAPLPGDWALPGPRAVIDADPDAIKSPHHNYPAWDWIIASNTPIYAVRGGRVDTVRTWPHNWWSQGCGNGGGNGCDTCGVGLTIVDDAGHRWTYCHGTNLTARLGDTVTAGQQVMWSGNSGRSGTPHLHLEIRTNNIRRCPQPLVASLYHDGVGLDPLTLPTSGCHT